MLKYSLERTKSLVTWPSDLYAGTESLEKNSYKIESSYKIKKMCMYKKIYTSSYKIESSCNSRTFFAGYEIVPRIT